MVRLLVWVVRRLRVGGSGSRRRGCRSRRRGLVGEVGGRLVDRRRDFSRRRGLVVGREEGFRRRRGLVDGSEVVFGGFTTNIGLGKKSAYILRGCEGAAMGILKGGMAVPPSASRSGQHILEHACVFSLGGLVALSNMERL